MDVEAPEVNLEGIVVLDVNLDLGGSEVEALGPGLDVEAPEVNLEGIVVLDVNLDLGGSEVEELGPGLDVNLDVEAPVFLDEKFEVEKTLDVNLEPVETGYGTIFFISVTSFSTFLS